jgi:hypothetical protein
VAELSDRELDALARAVSRRLRAVVTEGASPSGGASDVGLRLGELVNQAGSLENNLVAASEAILSHAQDGSYVISRKGGSGR